MMSSIDMEDGCCVRCLSSVLYAQYRFFFFSFFLGARHRMAECDDGNCDWTGFQLTYSKLSGRFSMFVVHFAETQFLDEIYAVFFLPSAQLMENIVRFHVSQFNANADFVDIVFR